MNAVSVHEKSLISVGQINEQMKNLFWNFLPLKNINFLENGLITYILFYMAEWGVNSYNARKEIIEIRRTAKLGRKGIKGGSCSVESIKNLYWGFAMCQALY